MRTKKRMLVRGQLNVIKEDWVCGASQDPDQYDKIITSKVADIGERWERNRTETGFIFFLFFIL